MQNQKNTHQIFFIIIPLLFIFLLNCGQNNNKKKSPQKVILTGWQTESQLFNEFPEYKQGKEEYIPDSTAIEYLKKINQRINVLVFLGTWCPDCKREVPRFLKTMELTNNEFIKFQLMGLDRTKRDSLGLAEKSEIEFVPTFVVFHQDQEIRRNVEIPSMYIEQDLVEILEMNFMKREK